jgi:nitroreductase
MEVFEAIKTRRSVRRYTAEPVSEDLIEKIIEAGKAAPSAGNLQSRDFFVTENKELKKRLAAAALNQIFISQAPVVIVVCTNSKQISSYGQRGTDLYAVQDASAAAQNMLLAIHALGLASCWIGAFDEASVSEILELPGNLRPVAILPIGYPAESSGERKKRTDDVHWVV